MQYPILNMDKDLSFVAYRIFVEVLRLFRFLFVSGAKIDIFGKKSRKKLLYSLKIEILY